MITLGELDSLRRYLDRELRLFQDANAIEIGHARLRRFADYLDRERRTFETALENEGQGKARAKYRSVQELNRSMMLLARPARDLSVLVRDFKKPAKPGDLAGSTADLRALREQLGEVEELTFKAIDQVDATRKVLARPSRGAPSGNKAGEGRSYRCEPMVVVVEYRR